MAAVAAALGATGATAGPADVEADCEELQAALDNAQPGQVITLNEDCSETDDEIDLPFELPSRDSGEGAYTLQGSEEDAGISIDGEGDDRLITGTNTRPVVIRNLTFQNGRACQQPEEGDPPCEVPDDGHGGAIFVSGDSPLTIGDGDRFIDNEADGDGGAVHIDQSGAAEVLVYDNDFGGDEDGNVAGGSGGALYVESDAPVTVGDDPNDDTAGNLFDANEATHGGGVSVVDQTAEVRGADEGGLVTLENSTYTDNLANSSGGGAQVDMENAPVSVSGNDFGAEEAGNLAGFGGGGASINTPHSVDVVDNGFTGNVGLLRGGGLDVGARDGAAPNLTGNDFIENLSFGSGGGARVSTCDGGSLDGNTFEGNFLAFLLGIPGGEGRLERGKPIEVPQFGAGLEAVLGDCNPNDAPWVQTDNRFRENVIIADFFGGSAAAGGGEFVRQLRLQSTNDRFVGNTVEAASEEDTAGGGLALDLGFQGAATVRNLVAAGNRVVFPAAEERGNGEEPAGRGGGVALFGEGSDADLEVLDSTVEGNVAREGSGIGAASEDEPVERTALPTDRLILHNSIVFDNTGHEDDPEDGSDGEVFGFPERDVRFSDLCVDGAPHDDGDGSDPNSNLCTDPLLVGPVGDEDVDQTSSSPTIDAGLNELVPDDLGEDYAGDPRITDGNRDGTATVDMGADEFPGPIPAATPTPTQPAAGCVNAVGRVRGRSLGPARLGRTRAAQREIFRGARLRSRPGMDKYCASPNGLFRLGYPTGRILSRVGRGLRRAVSNRVVLILTTSRGTTLSGVRPGVTRSSEVPRRLRRTRRRVGKNTWFVTRTRNNVLLLIKVQRGLVREIGIGDSRLARGDGRQLKRYLKTWQALF